MATRTRKATNTSKANPVDAAREAIVAHIVALPKQSQIARALNVSGKTLRACTRSGIPTGERDAKGNAVKLDPVMVDTQGDAALTDTHKRALALRYMPDGDAAIVALAKTLAS